MIDFVLDLNPGLLILAMIILFIGLVSQIAMYAKAGKQGLTALVPVMNVFVFMDIVGRPKWHSIFLLIPGTAILVAFILYFPVIDGLFPIFIENADGDMVWSDGPSSWSQMTVPLIVWGASLLPMALFIGIVFTEICDSFGKHELKDKIYCIIFNGAYLLFAIGISDAEYEGPWYAKKNNLPYTMPEIKGTTKKKKSTLKTPDRFKKSNTGGGKGKSKSKGKSKGQGQSEVLAAIAEKYKKKK